MSIQIIPNPLDLLRLVGSNLMLFNLIDAEYVIFSFKVQEQNLGYFIEFYDKFSTGILTRLQRNGELEDKTFLISYYENRNGGFSTSNSTTSGNVVKAYAGIGDEITINEMGYYTQALLFRVTKYSYSYSDTEQQKIDQLYGDDDSVSLQFDLIQREVSQTPPQNIAQSSLISYDSVSSLGPISSESFTISSTSAGESEDVESGTEVITDVGGVVSRNRELQNTGVSAEIMGEVLEEEAAASGGGMEALTNTVQRVSSVTTSGY